MEFTATENIIGAIVAKFKKQDLSGEDFLAYKKTAEKVVSETPSRLKEVQRRTRGRFLQNAVEYEVSITHKVNDSVKYSVIGELESSDESDLYYILDCSPIRLPPILAKNPVGQ